MHIYQPPYTAKGASLFCFLVLLQLGSVRGEKVVVVAGGGKSVSEAPATQCRLHEPFGVAFDPLDNLIIVEMEKGQRVLKVDSRGLLHIVAGNGQKGDAGDGGP